MHWRVMEFLDKLSHLQLRFPAKRFSKHLKPSLCMLAIDVLSLMINLEAVLFGLHRVSVLGSNQGDIKSGEICYVVLKIEILDEHLMGSDQVN